jgi:hypothetical protein
MLSFRTLYVKLTNTILTVRSGGTLEVLSGGTLDIQDGATVTAPYDTYSNDWNGRLSVPTKHDVYTKIETLSAGASAWGDITGTLADQTDLQSALDAKQPLDTQLTDFAGLSYAGNSAKVLAVNVGETGLEFITPSGGSGLSQAQVFARTSIGF